MSQNTTDNPLPLTNEQIEQTFEHFGLALAIYTGSKEFAPAQEQIKQTDIDVFISLWFQRPSFVIAALLEGMDSAFSTILAAMTEESEDKDNEINQLKDKLTKAISYFGSSDHSGNVQHHD